MTQGRFCLSQPPPAGPTGRDGTGHCGAPTRPHVPCGGAPGRHCGCITFFLGGELPADLSRGGEAAASAPPGRGRGGWLALSPRAVPEKLALLFLPALRASRRPTPPHPRRECIALPAAALHSAFHVVLWLTLWPGTVRIKAKLPSTRASRVAATGRENHPELPFGHRRSSQEANGALRGQRHPGNPGVALTPSLNVRLDRSAWTRDVFAPSSCSVLGVAFSSCC